jgi:hypothetical protein
LIEKMQCHQMAAVHMAGMELLVKIQESQTLRASQPGELAKLTNAAARLFEVFQSGCLTLQKLKSGGRQHVLVQRWTSHRRWPPWTGVAHPGGPRKMNNEPHERRRGWLKHGNPPGDWSRLLDAELRRDGRRLPVSSHAESDSLPVAWRQEHWSKDA